MNGFTGVGLFLSVVIGISACTGASDAEMGEAAADAQPADGMEDMEGMEDMDMSGMQSAGMMDQMTSRMQMMQGMNADSMMAMMPAHRQMAANLLAEMNQEMRAMNMAPDAQWNATVDSVRQDLTRMPEVSAVDMQPFMAAHHRRMMRLMEMHRGMTAGMER